MMKMVNEGTSWWAKVENFGWRSMSGFKAFTAESGEEFLREILPDTDCQFRIYDYEFDGRKGFKVQNYHHDSPVGNEWYYILVANDCQQCGEPIEPGKEVQTEDGEVCEECYDYYYKEEEEEEKTDT
jgi:hypothetical protein